MSKLTKIVGLVAAVASLGTGCLETTVSIGSPGGGGAGGAGANANVVTTQQSVTVVSSTAGGGTSTPTAVAVTEDQLPPGANPCGFQTCDVPPDMLFIELASLGNTCDSPYGASPSNMNWWRVGIGLPVEHQAVGTYSLSDQTILIENFGMFFESGTAAASTGGGPGASSGTIQITSIDEDSVSFTVSGLYGQVDLNGDYVATRCAPTF